MFTIVKDYRNEIVIEKSRFICSLKKVASETEAQEFIKGIKKEFWDATHNCSAYVIDEMQQRSSDDGEPTGTAGVPMLEVLKKNSLFYTAAVVTRYFGGIKLGTGGLIRAYTASVAEAVLGSGIAERVLLGRYSFQYDIEGVGKILNSLYGQQLFEVADVEYTEQASVVLRMKDSNLPQVESWLGERLNSKVTLQRESDEVIEVPLD